MRRATTAPELRAAIAGWRRDGARIGFVPTMGNLHDGHFGLVGLARRHSDRVVASVFVNPTQFGPNEDYDRYPRTLDADAAGLAAHGCDLLFAPDVPTMYPFGAANAVRVSVPGVTEVLDGAHRPGHFDGVATVVLRLFNLVQPDVAVFGEKDWQQLQVIRYLVRDLALPIELVGAPTRRELDGLAMSSRNQYLDAAQRAIAPEIHRTLQAMREAVRRGRALDAVAADARQRLEAAGFAVDYAELRHGDLSPALPHERDDLVALVAARLGRTRLIDNLRID